MNLSKNLEEFLKKKKLDDLINFSKLGFQANNLVLLETLEKLNKNIFHPKNNEKNWEKEYFSICRNGNADMFNFYMKKNKDIGILDENKNNCLHYASRAGNFELIKHLIKKKYFDPNETNKKKETPLHYMLKYGGKKYMKIAILLAEHTNLTLKDEDNLEPNQITVKNVKENFRLPEVMLDLLNEQLKTKQI